MKKVYLGYLIKPMNEIMVFDGDQVNPVLAITYLKKRVYFLKFGLSWNTINVFQNVLEW